MFKLLLYIGFLLGLIYSKSVYGQNDSGIEVEKKPRINPQDQVFLEDSVMTDKFVVTEPALQIDKPLDEQLLPLDSLIAIAEKNHPALTVMDKVVEREKAVYQHGKVEWTRNIFATGFYFQGNSNALITSTIDANASTSLTNGARYGLTINVPLYEVVGRRRKNKINELNYEVEESRIDVQKREISQQVTTAYANLISAQRIFFIASDGLQASTINKENAQNEFEAGMILLTELSRILEIDLRIRTDHERARAAFYNAFYQLEIVVGEKLENLVAK
ncbi:MAG: TolC family protein [Luteibaculum sp.]